MQAQMVGREDWPEQFQVNAGPEGTMSSLPVLVKTSAQGRFDFPGVASWIPGSVSFP